MYRYHDRHAHHVKIQNIQNHEKCVSKVATFFILEESSKIGSQTMHF